MKKTTSEDRLSQSYDNRNAKKECPECDSLETFYHKNIFHCSACGYRERVMKSSVERAMKLGKLIAVAGTILGISYWLF